MYEYRLYYSTILKPKETQKGETDGETKQKWANKGREPG